MKEVEESLAELRRAYAELRVLLSTTRDDKVREKLRAFGVAMAAFEEAAGVTGGESEQVPAEVPPPGGFPEHRPKPEDDASLLGVTKGLWRIGDELHYLNIALSKHFADQARFGVGRKG